MNFRSLTEVFCEKGKKFTVKLRRYWHRCFPVNFAKFVRTPIL